MIHATVCVAYVVFMTEEALDPQQKQGELLNWMGFSDPVLSDVLTDAYGHRFAHNAFSASHHSSQQTLMRPRQSASEVALATSNKTTNAHTDKVQRGLDLILGAM